MLRMIFHLIINKKSHLCQIGVLECLFVLQVEVVKLTSAFGYDL